MKPNLLISYSRREVSFVNNLVDDLEDNGFNVWLDYRNLIPGKSWKEQIDEGIANSEVILLVVSKEALKSENVKKEWDEVLALGKRVVLVIFEPVDFRDQYEVFETYEWVDFRGNYKKALKELFDQLENPIKEEKKVPERGFKAPVMVWVAFILSLIVAVYSLGAIWTLIIPYLLVTLPFKLFKRNYYFVQVQAALVMLPIALLMTNFFVESDELFDLTFSMMYSSIPFVVALFFVLRSPTLQRWGKPMATLPKFANPYDPDNPNPDPVSFYIEHAPEDEKVAREMAETLKEYGHPQVDTMEQAKAVFVLISTFKTDTEANPQEQVVYPVYIQTADIKSKDLRRIQWIDFRNGVRDLHEIAQLLPDPAKLLKALGIRPMGRQLVLPSVIQYLMYFIIALAIFTVGSWLPFLVQYLPDILDFSDADVPLVLLAINLIVFVALSVLMFRALIRRKGWPSSVKSQIMSMLVLGGLVLWQLGLGDWVAEALGTFDVPDDFRGFSSFFPPVIYFVGNFIMLIFSLRKRREINRWFPSKVKK